MAKIVKVIPLTILGTVATGSTSYHVAVPNFSFLWLSALYPNSKVYFEAVIDGYGLAGYYGYAALYTTGGSFVTGSELRHDTTTPTRFRSGELTLTDNTVYELWLKSTNSGIPGHVYTASLIIVQEAADIAATETQIIVGRYLLNEAVNASYTDVDGELFYYDSAQFDGTINIYFEAILYGSAAGGTIYAKLYDTDGNAVADSEVSVLGSTATRVRSGAITLTTGKTYIVRMKHSGGILWDCMGARIIIQQTNTPTKTQTVIPMAMHQGSSAATSYTAVKGRFYWDDDEWSVVSKDIYYEVGLKISNAAYTAYMELWNGASQVDERTTQETARTRLRSAALSLVDNTTYTPRYKSSNASGTLTFYGARLIVLIQITSGAAIVREFADTGSGSETPKTDRQLLIADTGSGLDKFLKHLEFEFIEVAAGSDIYQGLLVTIFDDAGAGIEDLDTFKTLIFYDAGSGVDTPLSDKILIIADIGSGLDAFLRDKEDAGFYDDAYAADRYKASYPYPKDLKRILIKIRDRK